MVEDLSPKFNLESFGQEVQIPSLFQDQPSQTIGGMLAGSRELVHGKIRIQGIAERILFGDATSPTVGVGIFLGEDGQGNGDYDFRIGDPAGTQLWWDASTGTLTISGVGGGSQNFVSTLAWTATDRDTATWSSGTIKTSGGTSYSIAGGNTGNIAATTYIYLDPDVSATVLQTTTTAASAMGGNKLLVATVEIGAVGSECIITVVNSPGTTISGSGIVTGSITAAKISVSSLSAISADVGTITAGSITGITITGGTIRTASSGSRVEMLESANAMSIWDGSVERAKVAPSGITIFGDATLNFKSEGSSTTRGAAGISSTSFLLAALDNRILDLASSGDNIRLSSLNTHDIILNSSRDIEMNSVGNFKVDGVTKTAIVSTSLGYRALYCVEAPEVWFMDFCDNIDKIDPLFLEVTDGDMKFIKVENGGYQVWRRRKGFDDKRFEQKTEQECERNNRFWDK